MNHSEEEHLRRTVKNVFDVLKGYFEDDALGIRIEKSSYGWTNGFFIDFPTRPEVIPASFKVTKISTISLHFSPENERGEILFAKTSNHQILNKYSLTGDLDDSANSIYRDVLGWLERGIPVKGGVLSL